MPLPNPFKLEKLKVVAYRDRDREQPSLVSTFEAMFNPASYSHEYEVMYGGKQPINKSASEARFTLSGPQTMTIDLLLDGTGVDSIGLHSSSNRSVRDRVKAFLDTAYVFNGSIHEPNFLVLQWGDDLAFECRLKKATVAYTSFDRGGNPLRAKLTIVVLADETADKIARSESRTSPDVTHSRVVRAGDTLPLLCEEIYGSADDYLDVARFNDLDHFRDLAPGREVVFPPLVKR